MKPERAFVAERTVAQHCPELLRSSPAPAELVPSLARLGERLARALSTSLAPLSGGDAPMVRCEAPRECAASELANEIGLLAANSLLGAGEVSFLASLDAGAVLRLVDRAFGGRGEAPDPLPDAFPLSAELMIIRLEAIVAAASASALGRLDGVRKLRRDGNIVQLAPFAAAERLAVLDLIVADGSRAPWHVTLAFPLASLAELLDQGDMAPARNTRHAPINPSDEPFGEVPLTVSAVLVDMCIGFSALSALEPGQILPVAVHRSVPLKIGDKTVAHGTIGALDDRVAVQITQAF